MPLREISFTSVVRRGTLFVLYCLTAGLVVSLFVFRPGINWYERATFPDMVYGTAHRPYVYRALVPTIIRSIAAVTPSGIKDAVRSSGEGTRVIRRLGWEPQFLFEYAVAVVLFFCMLVGLAFVLRKLVLRVYSFPPFVADMMPIIGLIVLPVFFRYYSHIYDPVTLFLSSLALLFLVTERKLFFYLIFVLSTINKETSVLLIGLFIMKEYSGMVKGKLLLHAFSLSLLWIFIKGGINFIFRNNPGEIVEFHFDHTMNLFRDFPSFAYLIAVTFGLGSLTFFGWKEKPLFLRQGVAMTLLPLALLAIFLGSVDETRGYYEAFPYVFMLIVPTIVTVFDMDRNPANYSQELPLPK